MVSHNDHVIINHHNQTRTNGIWGHVLYSAAQICPPTSWSNLISECSGTKVEELESCFKTRTIWCRTSCRSGSPCPGRTMEFPCVILGHWEDQGSVEHSIESVTNIKTDYEYWNLDNMFWVLLLYRLKVLDAKLLRFLLLIILDLDQRVTHRYRRKR
jgi:hypothetical protein